MWRRKLSFDKLFDLDFQAEITVKAFVDLYIILQGFYLIIKNINFLSTAYFAAFAASRN